MDNTETDVFAPVAWKCPKAVIAAGKFGAIEPGSSLEYTHRGSAEVPNFQKVVFTLEDGEFTPHVYSKDVPWVMEIAHRYLPEEVPRELHFTVYDAPAFRKLLTEPPDRNLNR